MLFRALIGALLSQTHLDQVLKFVFDVCLDRECLTTKGYSNFSVSSDSVIKEVTVVIFQASLCVEKLNANSFFTKEFLFDVSSFLGLTFYTELLSGGEQKIEL